MWATCPRSATSGYHAEFHEGCYQKHTNPLNCRTSSSDISGYHTDIHEGTQHCRRMAWAWHGMCELTRHGMAWARHGICELAFTHTDTPSSSFLDCYHGMARPQVADGGTASDMEGSWE
jgi:hypothetical protein